MWDLPGPGLEPVSPALAGRLSTTVPPGKSGPCVFDGHNCRGLHGVNGQGQCVGQLCAMKDCPTPKANRVPQVEKLVGSDS